MKILVIGLSDNPGGVEAFIKNYFNQLGKNFNFDFMVFVKECVDREWYLGHGAKIYYIKHAQFREPLKYKKELKRFFENHKNEYDAIWVNVCDLANAGAILKTAKCVGIHKRIIHSHNNKLMHSGKKAMFYMMMHTIVKYRLKNLATDFWSCSEEAGDFFYPEAIRMSAKYKVINNAIDTNAFRYDVLVRENYRKELGLDNKIVIGHVGRFHMQKNHDFLIDIFDELIKKNASYHLLLIGQGELEEGVKQKVTVLGLENNVSFLGIRNDIQCLLQAMDLFLFPSRFEGLGIALVEAQAAGLQCFTSADVVPQTVNLTGLVKYIDLKQSPLEWADVIDSTGLNYEREECFKKIIEAGYDIITESEKMKQLMNGSSSK